MISGQLKGLNEIMCGSLIEDMLSKYELLSFLPFV